MSGIAGYIGRGSADELERMIAAIPYRGDTSDQASGPGWGLACRFWHGRANKTMGILQDAGVAVACAGTLAPQTANPAWTLKQRLLDASDPLADLDGAFGAAVVQTDGLRLTLVRDPFGVRSLYYVELGGTLYFATELKQLLALPQLSAELDLAAIHKYLTFSFVPGEAVPIRGVRRLLPGHRLEYSAGRLEIRPYFQLSERLDPELEDLGAATLMVSRLAKQAVQKRLGDGPVGLFLSGGLDSAAVGTWLKQAGAEVHAFSLDFGAKSVEREQAEQVAKHLGIPLTWVPVDGTTVNAALEDAVWKLDLPFGDPVTVPQYLLGAAARKAGINAVFNGEGGDQLFGGWTSKPMVAAAVYGGMFEDESPEEQYLRAWHRFYGHEEKLYTTFLRDAVGGPGQRRALLAPYLGDDRTTQFLNRVRLTDISLKGSQNILPRAERMSNAHGLDLRVPLFDRELAEASFALPTGFKLHGACEKYVLKRAMQWALPEDIVWRRKFGMSVPVTDWVLGPMADRLSEVLGEPSLQRRGLFVPSYVTSLRAGVDHPAETRKRRIGEKLWTLLMLELWLRAFVDRRGQR